MEGGEDGVLGVSAWDTIVRGSANDDVVAGGIGSNDVSASEDSFHLESNEYRSPDFFLLGTKARLSLLPDALMPFVGVGTATRDDDAVDVELAATDDGDGRVGLDWP
jgi:hypothetical protein